MVNFVSAKGGGMPVSEGNGAIETTSMGVLDATHVD